MKTISATASQLSLLASGAKELLIVEPVENEEAIGLLGGDLWPSDFLILSTYFPHAIGDTLELHEPPRLADWDFVGYDNNDPQQLWSWRGEQGDEAAEAWERLHSTLLTVKSVEARQANRITYEEHCAAYGVDYKRNGWLWLLTCEVTT